MSSTRTRWQLSYWIRGQPFCFTERVLLSPHKTIDDIKKAIFRQTRSQFREWATPPKTRIYKIPQDIPVFVDGYMEEILGSLSISVLGEPLLPTDTLSSVFKTQPPGSQLHLIVDIDFPYFIRCYIRRERIGDYHVILNGKTFSITELKCSIIKARIDAGLDLERSDPGYLKLYKASHLTDDELTEVLQWKGMGQPLSGNELLGTLFDSVPFSATPRVIADVLDKKITESESDPRPQTRTEGLVAVSPSDFSHPEGDHPPRRTSSSKMPPELLHSILGQYFDDCRTLNICREDYKFIKELRDVVEVKYRNGAQYKEALNKLLTKHGLNLHAVDDTQTEYTTNAYTSVNEHHSVIIQTVIGPTAGITFHALRQYLLSRRRDVPVYPGSSVPLLVMAIQGSQFSFGAFSPFFLPTRPRSFGSGTTFRLSEWDFSGDEKIARYFAAFRKAVKALDDYYISLQKTKISLCKTIIPSDAAFAPREPYPHKTSYERHNGEEIETVEFRYDKEVEDPYQLTYFGTEVEGNERICIKFSRRYCKEAHNFLTSQGYAPILRAFQRIDGDWTMIVYPVHPDFEILADRKHPPSSTLLDSITEVLNEFHAAGFVHGDIRDVNIAVSKTDETKFMFVHLDWAGKEGKETRYPAYMDTSIERAEKATEFQRIRKKHDWFMLDQLRLKLGAHLV